MDKGEGPFVGAALAANCLWLRDFSRLKPLLRRITRFAQ